MEVKGDFCRQVHAILKDAQRGDDYVEIGLDTGVCYNPLHNDLDPYAVAYAIATLLNNLFGKSKEPFWQQAYTDLLKFVILLRRLTDGYTTFAEVYRYILDDTQIDHDIRQLKTALAEPPEVLLVPMEEYRSADCAAFVDALVSRKTSDHMAHPYDAELETYLAEQGVPYSRAARAGHGLDGQTASARGTGTLVRPRLESARRAVAVLNHRRRRRVPLAV